MTYDYPVNPRLVSVRLTLWPNDRGRVYFSEIRIVLILSQIVRT
jgi:hypothetical protein